jgi:hypothetical protein
MRPTLGHINPKSERAKVWREIFGGETVPLKSPLAVPVINGGVYQFECYLLDFEQMTPEQMEKLAEHLAKENDMQLEEVKAQLEQDGTLGVVAEDVGVSFDGRLVL